MNANLEVGARVRIAPHLDLWMAGVRFGTVVGFSEARDGTRLIEVETDDLRSRTFAESDLGGVVRRADGRPIETDESRAPKIESAAEWISIAVDEDGVMWVRNEIEGLVSDPLETCMVPQAEWLPKLLAQVEKIVTESFISEDQERPY